ncbi:MAG TPA: rod shape-determining protein MreC [Chlamydiales bacterium]|nr:rod shape-determining protein MreC [Chlamydiales bacterium]
MKRTIAYPFFALGLFLFCWINLPKSVSDRLRSVAVSTFGHFYDEPATDGNELARLRLENQNLRAQLDHACEWLLFDQRLGEQVDLYKGLVQKTSPFFHRRADHLRTLLQKQLFSVPAQVIYRDPSSWSSSLWVNVGEEDNQELGQQVVAKNSPVIAEGALVGVVDYVGKKQARVRLITDSGLSPSVRAVRGTHLEDGYLAKGEVHGSSAPFWRSRNPVLKGVGFNYDYADEEGGSRDLKGQVPLLKEGDSILTSGLDGVFPPGLRVGSISWVAPLKEGSYAYEIEVRPAAHNLNDLQTVFILPALSE